MSQRRIGRRAFIRTASMTGAATLGAVTLACTQAAAPETSTTTPPTAVAAQQQPSTSTGGGQPAGGAAPKAAAPPTVAAAAPALQAVEPRIDRVLKNGVLRVGVDLTFPPLQFRDKSNQPAGMMPEIDEQMAKDLGVKLEYVEMPFGELIAGLLADKFDWIGLAVTNTPKRAQQVMFIDEPAFWEDSFLLLKKGTSIKDISELNKSNITFSNLSGSAQDASAKLLFPQAQFKPLGFPENVLEVAAGRSDACLIGIWNAAEYLAKNPNTVDVWKGGALFTDLNTFFVPAGDFKTKEWMSNWFRYYGAAHKWIPQRFDYWMSQVSGYKELQALYAAK